MNILKPIADIRLHAFHTDQLRAQIIAETLQAVEQRVVVITDCGFFASKSTFSDLIGTPHEKYMRPQRTHLHHPIHHDVAPVVVGTLQELYTTKTPVHHNECSMDSFVPEKVLHLPSEE